jgi:hypothetical protein
MLMADREDVPRLSAVVERQRRELARVRAERDATVVTAMARGVLMERHGWSPAQAAGQLADLAAAAGLPEPEMAAAVLAQELSSPVAADTVPADSNQPDHAQPAPVQADRAKDGAELVGALAEQLRSRFGVAAVAVWLLDADGALELFGQDGLGGTESSRWRRLPPQFDCLEQRVITGESDLWWAAGPPADDQAAGPGWGSAWCGGSVVAHQAGCVRRHDAGLGGGCRGRVRRRARPAAGLRPGGVDGAVAADLAGA